MFSKLFSKLSPSHSGTRSHMYSSQTVSEYTSCHVRSFIFVEGNGKDGCEVLKIINVEKKNKEADIDTKDHFAMKIDED